MKYSNLLFYPLHVAFYVFLPGSTACPDPPAHIHANDPLHGGQEAAS